MDDSKNNFCGIDRKMWCYSVIVYLCICLGLRSIVFYLVGIAFGIYLLITKDMMYTFCYLLFLLPFEMIFKITPASTSLFTYFMLIAVIIMSVRFRYIKSKMVKIILVFTCYLFIGMGDNYTDLIKMAAGLMLLYFFVISYDQIQFKNYTVAFSLGLLGSCFIGNYKTSISTIGRYFSDWNREYIGGVVTYRFSGLYMDPNYFSISVILAIYLCMLLFVKKKVPRILSGILIGGLSFYGLKSYSKLFIISLLMLIAVFICSQLKNKRTLLWGILAFAVFFAFAVYLMQYSTIIGGIMSRFNTDDISNNRFSIWARYLSFIKDSIKTIIFGQGIGGANINRAAPHNTYIESLYCLGIVGSIIYVTSVRAIFKMRKLLIKKRKLNYFIIIIFLFMILTLGILRYNDSMFYYMLIWMGMNFPLGEMQEITESVFSEP